MREKYRNKGRLQTLAATAPQHRVKREHSDLAREAGPQLPPSAAQSAESREAGELAGAVTWQRLERNHGAANSAHGPAASSSERPALGACAACPRAGAQALTT